LSIVGLPRTGELRAHVRTQCDQAQIVPAVERQFDDPPVFDDRADGRILCRDERGDAGHFGRLGERADFEREIHAQLLFDVEFDGVLRGLEALQLGFDQVVARRHGGKRERSDLIALLSTKRVRRDVLGGDGCTRNRGTGCVFHFTGDGTERLGVTRGPEKQTGDHAQSTFQHALLLPAEDSQRRERRLDQRVDWPLANHRDAEALRI
jgi:hypothetical protein